MKQSNKFTKYRMARLTQEFQKLNGIIQELRRQNHILKQQNYELENQISQVAGQLTEEKVHTC